MRRYAAAVAACAGLAAVFAASPGLADEPGTAGAKPGDTSHLTAPYTIDGARVFCQDFDATGAPAALLYTLESGDKATLDPEVIWVLVHGGMLTPAQFEAESGIPSLTQDQLWDASAAAIWHFADAVPDSQLPDILAADSPDGVVPEVESQALDWLLDSAEPLEPTSATASLSIQQAAGYTASDGDFGPLTVTASSGVATVGLSASSGEIVDASGDEVAALATGATFYVKDADTPVTVTAEGTNVYVPGWMWVPSDSTYQRYSYAATSVVSAQLILDAVVPGDVPPTTPPTPAPAAPTTPAPTPAPTAPAPASVTVPAAQSAAAAVPALAPVAAGPSVATGGRPVHDAGAPAPSGLLWPLASAIAAGALGAGILCLRRRRA